MAKLQKLAALAVVFVMLFSVPAGAYTISPDVEGTNFEEAAYVLGALGIMVGDAGTGAFRPNDNITRAEFARVSVSLLGLDEVAEASKGQSKFSDVPVTHWANGYINAATAQKLIIGKEDGTFAPEENISYQDALTILIRALGHEPSANSKGGYPGGFLTVGPDIGLTKNAAGIGEEIVVRGMVANMAYNALTIKMMEQTGFGSNIQYEVTDKTILADKLNVEKGVGQITANEYTSVSGTVSLQENRVQIGGNKIFQAGNSNARNYLGYTVTYYARDNKDGQPKEMLLVRPDQKNKVLNIIGDNMHKVEQRQIEYWINKESDKAVSRAKISDTAVMIYNGIYTSYDHTKMFPNGKAITGNVKLLETTGDETYDIVFVNDVTNLVVEETIASDYKVVDKYGNPSLTLDPQDDHYRFEIMDADGGHMQFEDLKPWDVLSYTISEDKSLIIAMVSRKTVTGTVTEIEDGRYRIGDKAYQKADNFPGSIKLEDSGTFYLDALGRIAASDQAKAISTGYAYLVSGNRKTGLNGKVQLKVLTSAGELQALTLNEKVKFNNSNNMEAENIFAALADGNVIRPQLITFTLDEAHNIKALQTADDRSAENKLVIDTDLFIKNFAGSEVIYKENSGKLGRFNVNEDTLVFDIPTGGEETEYAVRDASMFRNDGKYTVEIFDVAEDLTAKVIVVTASDRETSTSSPIAVVNRITKTTNSQGDVIEKLYAAYDNQMTSFETKTTGLLKKEGKDLQQGDVVQLKTDKNGRIENISVLFDIAAKNTEFSKVIDQDMQILYGKVTQKFPASMNVTVGDGDVENYSLANAKVYSFDSTKNSGSVSVKSTADIQKSNGTNPFRVFVRIYEDVVQEVFMVR